MNTWSHWDEGGKKFGVYKDGDVIGNTNVNPNSLMTQDWQGRRWKIEFDYVEPKFHEYDFKPKGITCDGELVKFPDLYEPMALALANDGQLMIADSQTSPRQQVLFYDVTDSKKPKLTRAFGDYGGIASGRPGEVTSPAIARLFLSNRARALKPRALPPRAITFLQEAGRSADASS